MRSTLVALAIGIASLTGCAPAHDAAGAWQAWDESGYALTFDQFTRVEYVGRADAPLTGHVLVDGYLFRITKLVP